jgi:hypothetical protein
LTGRSAAKDAVESRKDAPANDVSFFTARPNSLFNANLHKNALYFIRRLARPKGESRCPVATIRDYLEAIGMEAIAFV